MDVSFMTAVVTSGTTVLTDTVGALFTFITSTIPLLLGLAAVGFIVYLIKRAINSVRRV